MPDDLKPVELTAIDTNTHEWVPFPIPQLGVELSSMPLIDDPDTGMQVIKLIYRAGWTNPWHTHPLPGDASLREAVEEAGYEFAG